MTGSVFALDVCLKKRGRRLARSSWISKSAWISTSAILRVKGHRWPTRWHTPKAPVCMYAWVCVRMRMPGCEERETKKILIFSPPLKTFSGLPDTRCSSNDAEWHLVLSQSWFLITLIYPNGAPIDAVNRKLAVCANAGGRLNRFKAAHKRRKKRESVMRSLIVEAIWTDWRR